MPSSFIIVYKAADHEKYMTEHSWSENLQEAHRMNIYLAIITMKAKILLFSHLKKHLKIRFHP